MGPLTGLKVVEIAHWLVAPYCTNMFSDLGAEVTKIEPLTGDQVRSSGSYFKEGESYLFAAYNHGKRSISLNLKEPAGLEIAKKLCAEADIIVENYRPGTCDRLGVGYEDVKAINPTVIYCSISAFGDTSDFVKRPGMDPIVQGMGAIMSLTGEGGEEEKPMLVGVPVADVSTAYIAFGAVCAALVDRERNGIGQHVKVNLIDSMVYNLSTRFGQYVATGASPKPMGNMHAEVVPYQGFPTADGWIMAGAQSEAAWAGFCEAIGRNDLRDNPKFATNSLRLEHRKDITAILNEEFKRKTSEEWFAILSKHQVLNGPIWNVKDLIESDLIRDHGMVVEVQHERFGNLPILKAPIQYSEREVKVQGGPPMLGEHTTDVLIELGYSKEQIDRFVEQNVVKAPQMS